MTTLWSPPIFGARASRTVLVLLVALGASARCLADELQFLRGDANNDGRVSISDGWHLAHSVGEGPGSIFCQAAADVDRNGQLEFTDTIRLISFLFLGKGSIAAPFPACGADPKGPPLLSCDAEPVCGPPIPPVPGRFRFFISSRADAEAPDEVPLDLVGLPGETVETVFHVYLSGTTEETGQGAVAWSLGISAESDSIEAALRDVDWRGTLSEEILNGGFTKVEPASDRGAVDSYVLSFETLQTTDPARPASEILRGKLRVTVPASGDGKVFLRPVDGLRGSGQPVDMEVTAQVGGDGTAFKPDAIPLEVHVRRLEAVSFLRGDANHDGKVDVSDALHGLRWLFRGGEAPLCADAADSNDDGTIDLSDSIFIFGCLFLGSDCPSAPHPLCTVDRTEDELDCATPGPACS